jgi:hypothetical protein
MGCIEILIDHQVVARACARATMLVTSKQLIGVLDIYLFESFKINRLVFSNFPKF